MKITFLGTRGYIDARSKIHYRHTSTLISYKGKRILIDCGLDWLGKIEQIKPDAIFLTHAHPDHSWGLEHGAPCPVYATQESWDVKELKTFAITEKNVIHDRQKIHLWGITIEVFSVVHSIRCPAVGYRITAGRVTIFCAHDLISIHERAAALRSVSLYIGDGATIMRPMLRRRGTQLFGHTTIKTQLGWCKKEKISRAIFTHCGTQIVAGNAKIVERKIRELGLEMGVITWVAHDGMSIVIR